MNNVPTPTVVDAPVKSLWTSKINITQVVAAVLTMAVGIVGALNLNPEQTAQATAGVAVVGQVATFIFRTFFTTSVLSSSVGK